MFERLGRAVVTRRRWIVAATIIFFVVAGGVGGGVAEKLSNGGFQDPNAESSRASRVLETEFGARSPNIVLLVSADGSVDDPEVAREGRELTKELAEQEGLAQVISYWTTGIPALKSTDGDRALVAGLIKGDEDKVRERIEELSPEFTRDNGSITIAVGGFAEVFRQVGETIEADLVRAESIAFPITLILLVIVFGSLIAAALPLVVGIISIVGSFLILTLIAQATDVSIFALNLVTAMGLGLAIDYSLFVVSRFREELRKGHSPDEAVGITVRTAGRTVAFSGLTVAISLAALLVFPLDFLKSFAYAGVAVVILAAVTATVFLPAVLAMLGTRIDKFSVRRTSHKEAAHDGFWHRVAMFVMKRPVPIATIVIVFMLFLGAPFLGVEFGLPDDRVLPTDASSHQVSQVIREEFSVDATTNLLVVAPDVGDVSASREEIESYAASLSNVDRVFAVDSAVGSFVDGEQVAPPNEGSARYLSDEGTYFTVVPAVEAVSPAGEELVRDVRALGAPFDVQVAGASADLVDSKESVFGRVPLAGLLIAITTFVLLFLMFGGVLVPVKAIVLNLLSLTATFGALVWVFQEGNLSESLDFIVTGTIDVTSPILMFCIAFGLSMDYEVFMLSRIKEEYDRTGDNQAAVAMGLERTGGIVTAAAAILSIVFVAFITSGVTFIKLFGVGLTLAVLMDATLVRATLVPAFMRLAGRANWWAPGWMRKIHERFGISESDPDEHKVTAVPAEGSAT